MTERTGGSNLIDRIVERARDSVARESSAAVTTFVRRYFAAIAAIDIRSEADAELCGVAA